MTPATYHQRPKGGRVCSKVDDTLTRVTIGYVESTITSNETRERIIVDFPNPPSISWQTAFSNILQGAFYSPTKLERVPT